LLKPLQVVSGNSSRDGQTLPDPGQTCCLRPGRGTSGRFTATDLENPDSNKTGADLCSGKRLGGHPTVSARNNLLDILKALPDEEVTALAREQASHGLQCGRSRFNYLQTAGLRRNFRTVSQGRIQTSNFTLGWSSAAFKHLLAMVHFRDGGRRIIRYLPERNAAGVRGRTGLAHGCDRRPSGLALCENLRQARRASRPRWR